MENHHLDITEKTLRLMDLRPGERVLDLGCGIGVGHPALALLAWSERGLKVSARSWGSMSPTKWSGRRARLPKISKMFALYAGDRRSRFRGRKIFSTRCCRSSRFITMLISDRALSELFRVMAPHGRLFILINLYRDNAYSLQWVDKLKVPVHVRSQGEYVELLKKHAFENVEARRIPDDTPTPDNYKTKSFHSLEDLQAFKKMGALLLMASKPDLRTRALLALFTNLLTSFCVGRVPSPAVHLPTPYFTSLLYFFSTSRRRSWGKPITS